MRQAQPIVAYNIGSHRNLLSMNHLLVADGSLCQVQYRMGHGQQSS